MSAKNFNIKYNSGFTLIETFVAITILMIAILGPMDAIAKFYADSAFAKDQIAASFLAQDGMETVENIIKSNTNYRLNSSASPCNDRWLAGLESCVSDSGCDLDPVTDADPTSGKSLLYKNSQGFYVNNQTLPNTASIFSRKITITIANGPLPSVLAGDYSSTYRSAQITSEVSWSEKATPEKVTVSSLIIQTQCKHPDS